MSYTSLIMAIKGGSGSGNFGHSGRPGKQGGSAGGGGMGGSVGMDNALYDKRKAAMTGYYKSEAAKVKNSLERGDTSVGAQLDKWNAEKHTLQKQVNNPTSKGNAEDAKAAIDLIDEHVIPAINSAKITMIPRDVMPKISDRERRQIISSITGRRR